MTLAILATGDEIIHGDTLDTNSQAIAHALSSEGFPLGLHLTCSDKESDMVDCLAFLAMKHDIIIIIGGLGPTSDDLTRFALARFTTESLVPHQEALTHIKNHLNKVEINFDDPNRQQCLFPKKSQLLPNPYGTAMGCCYYWNNIRFILLPGPPRECLPMFHHCVIPLLQQTQRSQKQILKWQIFGLAESDIAKTLETALDSFNCQVGYRLDTPYIEFKVRCTQDLVAEIKKIVDLLVAPHLIAPVGKKASGVLHDLLLMMKEPISIIDEATGGVLESLLVKPETRDFLKFHNTASTKLVFYIRGLDEYWSQQAPRGNTYLSIHYSDQNHEGGETHAIPYRSPLVIHHAAEWLSFRLFHLINQLH